ncbi:MAG TPA: hypothetical protein VFL60_03075 [Gaiellaceae bacterium]|nr:hypothetical protein [Gaiellaceae bacterium]
MSAVPAALPRTAARSVAPRLVLAAIVLLGTVLQALLARLLPSPSVFPDEYLYSQLGRSLATTGHLQVRGVHAHFLSVLEPALTAPMWLVHDVGLAYRLVQLENAFVLSLAAIPAYLIARRLRVPSGLALALAGLVVVGPPAAFAGMILSEPFAYPLALAVVAAALRMHERPTRRSQLVLLALCALAPLARMQLAALPLCVAAALVADAARERRVREALRTQSLFLGAVGAAVAAGVAVAALRGFGYYRFLGHFAGAGGAMRLGGVDLYVVLLSAGAALVPSALVGLALGLTRPRFRAEFLFSVLTVLVGVAVLLESVLWEHFDRTQERYLCYLLPLLALAFGLRVSRATRRPLAETGVAAALAAVAALVPLNGAAEASAHGIAPFFYAFNRLQLELQSSAGAAGVVAIAATALAFAGALATRFRNGALVVVALSFLSSFALLGGAVDWSHLLARDARAKALPQRADWVDAAAGGPSTMLVVGKDAQPGTALATLFWNPDVTRVVRLPGGRDVDLLDDPQATVARDGTVRVAGAPLGRRVLLYSGATSASLAGGRPLARFGSATLWATSGAVRLGVVVEGRIADGHVLQSGGIAVWAAGGRVAGWLEARVAEPASLPQATVRLGRAAAVVLPAGGSRLLRTPVCGASPWTGTFTAIPAGPTADGWRSPLLAMPRYVPDPHACA